MRGMNNGSTTKYDSRLGAWAFGLLAFLALAIGAYALVMYGTPDHLHKQSFVTGKGSLPDLWYNILWAHAISAGVALAIGWLQFIKRLRHHALNIHRLIGYMYSIMITIGGITGLYLAFYANGGWFAQLGFGSLSVLWLYTLFRSLKSIIIDRDKAGHGRWMVRNYALGCAAITLRIYTGCGISRIDRYERYFLHHRLDCLDTQFVASRAYHW